MNNPFEMIANAIKMRNSNVDSTDFGKNALDTIRSGDSARGEQLADNICRSLGLSREQAIQQAKEFFKIR